MTIARPGRKHTAGAKEKGREEDSGTICPLSAKNTQKAPGDGQGKTLNVQGEKVKKTMSLEAIRQITETEQANQTRRAEVEAEARRLTAEAERAGQARLAQVRADAAEAGKRLLSQAEERAEERSREIMLAAEEECARQRRQAEEKLDAAAEFIVERVVKH